MSLKRPVLRVFEEPEMGKLNANEVGSLSDVTRVAVPVTHRPPGIIPPEPDAIKMA